MPLPSLLTVADKLRACGYLPMKEFAADFVEGCPTARYDLPEGHEHKWVDCFGDTITTLDPQTGTFEVAFHGDSEPFNRGDWADLINQLGDEEG